MSSQRPYRERIYIVKDIILKLVEYGQLNQTALISTCGLNFKKHSPILDKLQSKGLICKSQIPAGKRTVTAYKATNFKKHSPILDKLQYKGLICKSQIPAGKRTVTAYKATQKGIEFSRQILEPYEIMFPRTNTVLVESPHFCLILI